MKSINKTKNDSISEQASATKEEMIEFASKYKNIEAFKDSDDETTYWFIMLFILLMYIDYNTQKLWESFAEEVKTKNRFFPESKLLKKISDIAEKATCTISKGDILYRARDYTEQDFFKNDMVMNQKAEAVMISNGINLEGFMSSQITAGDFGEDTLVLTMEAQQRQKLLEMFPEAKEENVQVLTELVGDELEILDPYGGTLQSYGLCFETMNKSIKKLVKLLNEGE